MPRNVLIEFRRDTAANWTSADPTLASGEPGYETDTGKLKIGDGSTTWTSLPYFTGDVATLKQVLAAGYFFDPFTTIQGEAGGPATAGAALTITGGTGDDGAAVPALVTIEGGRADGSAGRLVITTAGNSADNPGEVLTAGSGSDAGYAIWTPVTGTLNFVVDGGGSTVTTGIKGDVVMPFAGEFTQVTLLADQSGDIELDIWNQTYGSYPPTVTESIVAAAPPTISSDIKSQDSTLTGWTTAFAAGDILRFNVNSVTSITRATLALDYTKQ